MGGIIVHKLDGTIDKSGYRDDVEGAFYDEISKTKLMDIWVAGGGSVGSFGTIILAMKTSTDGDVAYCYERYKAANVFTYELTESLCSTLVSKSIMTASEKSKFLNAWPKH